MSETPFLVRRLPALKESRPATKGEAIAAAIAWDYSQRHMGDWFFPLYRGQSRGDVRGWLQQNGHLPAEPKEKP